MDTIEITSLLKTKKCLKKLFKGVYALDLIPKRLHPPYIVIYNRDKSVFPGSHWQAFYVPKEGPIMHFDSLNLRVPDEIEQIIKKYKRKMICNNIRLQSLTSDVCGLYCIMFALCIGNGVDYKDFLRKFSIKKQELNDKFIIKEFLCHFSNNSSQNKNRKCKFNQICTSFIEKKCK